MNSASTLIFGNGTVPGLAQAIAQRLRGQCMGRATHGIDITLPEKRRAFINESLKYENVVICAYGPHFSQVLLLSELYQAWIQADKKGHIVAIGSSCEKYSLNRPADLEWCAYPVEKAALKEYVGIINANSKEKYPGIYATCVSPHHMNTSMFKYKDALDVKDVAETVEWVLTRNIHIEHINMIAYKSRLESDNETSL